MQRFADVTKELITLGRIERVDHCLQIAEMLFNKGTGEVKNAISNVFVFSVSTFLEIHNLSTKNLFPKSLNKEYYKQVNTSGV
jgi:hypothetical protein